MNNLFDMLVVTRIVALLTKPIENTPAYKLGIVNKDGEKIRDPETPKDHEAYTTLVRLCFNLRMLLKQMPGGKIGSAALVYRLLKEHVRGEEYNLSERSIGFLSEEIENLMIESLCEDMTASSVANADAPKKMNFKMVTRLANVHVFEVDSEMFYHFKQDRKRWDRWSETAKADPRCADVFRFVKSYPSTPFIVKNKTTGAMIFGRLYDNVED